MAEPSETIEEIVAGLEPDEPEAEPMPKLSEVIEGLAASQPKTNVSMVHDDIVRIPNLAYDALIAAIAKKMGNRLKYKRVPAYCTVNGGRYWFDVAKTESGILVRMNHIRNSVRQSELPGLLQDARMRSNEARTRLERCRQQLENESNLAASVLSRTAEETAWKDGEYSGGERRATDEQRQAAEHRVAKATEAYENAQAEADKAAALAKSLADEVTSGTPESRVFTLEDIENGLVLPKYKLPEAGQ